MQFHVLTSVVWFSEWCKKWAYLTSTFDPESYFIKYWVLLPVLITFHRVSLSQLVETPVPERFDSTRRHDWIVTPPLVCIDHTANCTFHVTINDQWRSFTVAAPCAWNNLLETLRRETSVTSPVQRTSKNLLSRTLVFVNWQAVIVKYSWSGFVVQIIYITLHFICECVHCVTVSAVWPSLHSPAYPSQAAFIRPSSPVMSQYPLQSYMHCTSAADVTTSTFYCCFSRLCLPVSFSFITRTSLHYVRVFAICLSFCLSVCNVCAPYSGSQNFQQYFFAISYRSHPLTSCKILQENPSMGTLNARQVTK